MCFCNLICIYGEWVHISTSGWQMTAAAPLSFSAIRDIQFARCRNILSALAKENKSYVCMCNYTNLYRKRNWFTYACSSMYAHVCISPCKFIWQHHCVWPYQKALAANLTFRFVLSTVCCCRTWKRKFWRKLNVLCKKQKNNIFKLINK